jgi:hypothetical protein
MASMALFIAGQSDVRRKPTLRHVFNTLKDPVFAGLGSPGGDASGTECAVYLFWQQHSVRPAVAPEIYAKGRFSQSFGLLLDAGHYRTFSLPRHSFFRQTKL